MVGELLAVEMGDRPGTLLMLPRHEYSRPGLARVSIGAGVAAD